MRRIIAVFAAALALGTAGAALAQGGGGDDPPGHEARHRLGAARHEVRGRIVAFENRVLTLRERDGDRVRGRVTAATRIECGRSAARAASHREDEPGDDRGDDACGTGALRPGRVVREAKLRTTGGGARFQTIELS
jgi:hypothetical protein